MSQERQRRDWIHRLYFDAYFEDALAKLRAKTGSGNTFAILNSLNEYWHDQGLLSEEAYVYHKEKYRLTLIEGFKKELQKPNLESMQKQNANHRLEKTMAQVLKQWPTLKPKSKEYWIKKARQYSELPTAQLILNKD